MVLILTDDINVTTSRADLALVLQGDQSEVDALLL